MTRVGPAPRVAPWVALCAALAVTVAGATPLFAQSTPAPGTGAGPAPMVVERVRSGFTAAPEVRFTRVDEQL